jgi:hypothetical protein
MKTTVGQQLNITSNGKKTEFSTGQADDRRTTGIVGDTLTNGAAGPTAKFPVKGDDQCARKRPGVRSSLAPRALLSTLPAISIFLL